MSSLSDAGLHRPLVVDLDGTLIRGDVLYESYFGSLQLGLRHQFAVLRSLIKGKANLKRMLANASAMQYQLMPYDAAVISLINEAKQEARPVYLATAADTKHAYAIAEHLAVFDGVFSSDGVVNLSGSNKANKLCSTFGKAGFDYVGNGADDISVWKAANQGFAVRASARVRRNITESGLDVVHLDGPPTTFRLALWAKALRVHQYAKNALIFVPLLTSHYFSVRAFEACFLALIAFCSCASAVYVINDLIDLDADRAHRSKQFRPFASGQLTVLQGLLSIPPLLIVCIVSSSMLSGRFALVILTYLVITSLYSLSLKRKMIIDVVTLSILYSVRVIGGAVAIDVVASEWLLAFSAFVFTSLAFIKRYVELSAVLDRGLANPSNRNYKAADLPIIAALAGASGYNAVTIFALYIASPTVQALYPHSELLWLLCPLLIYWLGRLLLMAHRRTLDDDPIVFALKDRVSQVAACIAVLVMLFASL